MKVILLAILLASTMAWTSYPTGEGPFAHMTDEQFAERYLMKIKDYPNEAPPPYDPKEFDAAMNNTKHFDWRNETHCIHPIRDQGHCGSCWAHAVTEMMSDRGCISGQGPNYVWSPQYMVGCANATWDAHGCDGADTQKALYWVAEYNLVPESCNPYTSGETGDDTLCYMTTCPSPTQIYFTSYPVKKSSIQLYNNYTNIEVAKDIMENGPIYFSMVVFADFKNYTSGVYYPTTDKELGTHAVKCIGYGWDSQKESHYWICANSWTTKWGEDGYFRIGFNQYIGYKAGSAQHGYDDNSVKAFLTS